MDNFETAKQLFFEGLRLFEANNFQAAEIKFARSLQLVPDRVSTLNNLSAVQIRQKKFAEAEEIARKAITLEDKSPEAWSNLGIALTASKRHEEALEAYGRAIHGNASYALAWLNKAMTLLELKRFDEALLACDQAQRLDSSKYEILYTKSRILKELQRPAEAQKIYRQSFDLRVASTPVVIGERRSTQKADALIINQNPVLQTSLESLESFDALHRYCPNFPGQLADHLLEDFHSTYVFVGNADRPSARKQIPQPDFVINNFTNGDLILSGGNQLGLTELVDSFGVPVVNHPTKAVQTTREASAKLLDDISGVLVPKTRRFSSLGKSLEELVHEIENQYDYPLITRSLAGQMGKGMTKVDSRTALVEVLSSGCPEQFYVTKFVDSRKGNKFYRKIRAAIVKDEIIIVRVDYSTNWNARGHRKTLKGLAFYSENMYLLDEEKRICLNPEAGLGRSTIQALRAIRDRIPLDVFGIDFDVDVAGQLVFYEANATMNLFSTARKEIPNPREADDCLKQAFQRYFTSLVARANDKTSPQGFTSG
jgi:tetratricopeptide (TPR) repeat protein